MTVIPEKYAGMTAEEYYLLGNRLRGKGDFAGAMSCYMEAVHLDPASPAAEALEMLESIMNFYCKDMYNP